MKEGESEDLRKEVRELKKEVSRLKERTRADEEDEWEDRRRRDRQYYYHTRSNRPHRPPTPRMPEFFFPARFFEGIGGEFFADFFDRLGESIGKTVEAAVGGAMDFGPEILDNIEGLGEELTDVDKFVETASSLAGALSDKTRLRILKALEPRSLETSELSEKVGAVGGNLAHHLGKLQEANLVRQKRRARYRLTLLGRMALKAMEALYWKSTLAPSPPQTDETEVKEKDEPSSDQD
jgi:DNA-binding transcriptional ArsR family regulator